MARERDAFPIPAAAWTTAHSAVAPPFLTRPYLGWHSLNSYFDHCSPDYGYSDGTLCTVDGLVARRANGYDPTFPKGYAATPGGHDYVYYDGHNGYDLGLSYEPLLAAAPGTVVVAGIDPVPYNACFGTTVEIDHGNGFTTRYAHMLSTAVVAGQHVARGQFLGTSGTSGCSTGPHLHFGVYTTEPWNAIDPWGWLGTTAADPYPLDRGNLWLSGNPQDPFPQAPAAPVAKLASTQASVTWTPGFDGGELISAYTVKASPGAATIEVPGTQTGVIFQGLTIGTAYSFTVAATNSEGISPISPPSNSVTPVNPPSTFYFAEGFTGGGYSERLRLFMPAEGGLATIDYFTRTGHTTASVPMTPGRASIVSVNAAVGPEQEVAIKVTLPGAGVAEREVDFTTAAWHGSNREVGVPAPQTTWEFAEGSTLKEFDEFLTLLNPNSVDVTVTLSYFTDNGSHPVHTVALAAGRRLTIPVFDPTLGVGRGVGGVSVQVVATAPVVAERPFYVNGHDFGSGPVRDGHNSFGVNAPNTRWYFAEGTTQAGFYEYLTLENPNPGDAEVSLRYIDTAGAVTLRKYGVRGLSRLTLEAFDSIQGVGRGVGGVSVQITSSIPIVAERPIYMATNIGGAWVAGADDAAGVQARGKLFNFAGGSSQPGDSDYLTLANTGDQPALVTITYYAADSTVVRNFTVAPGSRHTVLLGEPTEGVGPGQTLEGIVLSATSPLVVEKIGYSSNADHYGATATFGG